ncbi:hypothetical protein D1BOALGB6SA_6490 [Olavius sp. associated proteobacterium Delta 1]|nr:hypothetical protein D1BOALGB6SA_6490 [Olavius sp. associated proteobacterium Delta 1]
MENLKNYNVEQSTSGHKTIDSIEDFNKLLKRFPNDPALLRASADLMKNKNMPNEAALSYSKAATLYLKSGDLLPAIVSVVYSWHIELPSYQEVKLFLSAMRDDSFPKTPLKVFFENLSNPEVLNVVMNFKNIYLPAQQPIHRVNDTQDNLYFIVSGSLREVCYHPVEKKEEPEVKQTIINLSADDSIGDLNPLEEKKVCHTDVVTISPVELVKISREALLQINKKFPNIESGVQAINVIRSKSQLENQLKKNRKGIRQHLEKKLTIEIHPQSSEYFPIILEGYSTDFSIGGTCVILDAKDVSVAKSVASFSKTIKNSKVKISFPNEGLELRVSGKIAWTKEIVFPREKTLALGIQFQNLSPKLRGMLFVFADSSK